MIAGAQRRSRQRDAVIALLDEVDGFRTAQQLHAMLVARGESVGLTTVYRTLQLLVSAGEVDAMRPPGGDDTLYRRCPTSRHHHHLVCRHCGRAVDIVIPGIEDWADTTAAEHGFRDVTHTIEIFGACQDCAVREGVPG